ncbi:MAG TPA: tRNA glutamyl-Q(34) synthetase GluQRS [Phycisphaerae bacterium]|nr:tRNA glutamyl-Q(34) synthetase GluQRS [Phycisphaerae bacterium]
MNEISQPTTRLAPSPTGAMHVGNARTFLINELLAHQHNWRMLMRCEDLDSPRTKAGSIEQMFDELSWLGFTWTGRILYQSQRADLYRKALEVLALKGIAYPCICSRKDIISAGSAPHDSDSVPAYPGTCLGKFDSSDEAEDHSDRPVAWRVKVSDETIAFDDKFAGRCEINLAKTCGDFVIFRNEGIASYQLAVILDDAETDVDIIVRGDDLIDSTARQIHLRRLLGLSTEQTYYHLPLVIGADGRRLAKRHGDTRLSYYRGLGASAERILGLLAHITGLIKTPREITMEELYDIFDINLIPHHPIVFTPEHDAFMKGDA